LYCRSVKQSKSQSHSPAQHMAIDEPRQGISQGASVPKIRFPGSN
jgi:hypothetical protein